RRDVRTPAGRRPGRPRRRGNGIMLMTLSTRPVVTMTETDPGARDPLQVPAPQGLRAVERLDTALDRLGLRTPAARDRALAVLMVLVSSGMLWAFVRLLAEEDGIRLPPTATALLGVLVYTQSLALCVRRSRPVLCLAVMALTHLGTVALLPPHVTAQSLAPFIAAYTCGTLLPPRRLLRCITAVVVLLGLSGAAVAGTLPGVLLDPEAAAAAPRAAPAPASRGPPRPLRSGGRRTAARCAPGPGGGGRRAALDPPGAPAAGRRAAHRGPGRLRGAGAGRRARGDPPPLHRAGPAARRGGGRAAAGAGRGRGDGRARADGPRTARHRRPPPVRHGHPGGRRGAADRPGRPG